MSSFLRPSTNVVLIVLVLGASRANAQLIQPPARPSRPLFGGAQPPDPNKLRQQLSLSLDMLTGIDDNNLPTPVEEPTRNDALSPRPGSLTGSASTALSYLIGQQSRSLQVSGRKFTTIYRDIGAKPASGSELTASARTSLGSRVQVSVAHALRDDPYLFLGGFAGLQPVEGADLPTANSVNAVAERRSTTIDTSATAMWHASRRSTFSGAYSFDHRKFSSAGGYDSTTQGGSFSYDRSVSRRTSVTAAYASSNMDAVEKDGTRRPLRNNTLNAGMTYERRLSRTRGAGFSARVGVTQVKSVDDVTLQPVQYLGPAASTSAHIDLWRTWSVTGGYQRSVTVFQGVRPRSVLMDTTDLSLGGSLLGRLEAAFSGAYSTGQNGPGLISIDVASGRSITSSVTGQLRLHLSQSWSAVASYTRYDYRLSAAASREMGVAPQFDRRGFLIGLTGLLPIWAR
jgi:hypothetical protein